MKCYWKGINISRHEELTSRCWWKDVVEVECMRGLCPGYRFELAAYSPYAVEDDPKQKADPELANERSLLTQVLPVIMQDIANKDCRHAEEIAKLTYEGEVRIDG